MAILVIAALIIISFLWALYALQKEEKIHKRISHTRKELHKEKILFKN
jgi:hypothetical protein